MISIRKLKKRFGKKQILKGLSLDVLEGEILVILGRSGVGKSVLLKQIIGLEKPDEGSVYVDGLPISELTQEELYKAVKNMGMLFQGAALFDSMTIFENTAFYLRQHPNPETQRSYTEQEIKKKVRLALRMVGLQEDEDKNPADLSGGMRKRAALARLLVYRPKILLYDEPTAGLDPITSQQINELIVQTQDELQGTSIVVTHDMHSALYIADRLALHQDGKIAYVKPPEEFLEIDDPTIKFLKKTLYEPPRARKDHE
ncbi:MAG: ATP-binding cassette domain-containing protein [Chlamydiota bacterium]